MPRTIYIPPMQSKALTYIEPGEFLSGAEDIPDSSVGVRDAAMAYKTVSWAFRCITLRAQAAGRMPYRLVRKDAPQQGANPIDWPFATPFSTLMRKTVASRILFGQALWRKPIAPNGFFNWMHPNTMELKITKEGEITWLRKIDRASKPIPLTPKEVLYSWTDSYDVELGPGSGAMEVALRDAEMLHHIQQYASSFFRQGAMPGVLLTVEGNPIQSELAKLESWWQKLLAGVNNAWRAIAVRATVKPVVLTRPTGELAMPDLSALARENLAAALGIPMSMLTGASNFATARQDRLSFYEETVIPDLEEVLHPINMQVFYPMNMRLDILPETLDIMQEEERARSDSLLRLVNANVPTVLAMLILGYDLPPGWDWDKVEEAVQKLLDAGKPNRQAMRQPGSAFANMSPDSPGAPESTTRSLPMPVETMPMLPQGVDALLANLSRCAVNDLERWQRKAMRLAAEGQKPDFDFVSHYLDGTKLDEIFQSIRNLSSPEEVKRVFDAEIDRVRGNHAAT